MKVMSTTTRHFIKPLTISILIAIAVLMGNSKNGFAQPRCPENDSRANWTNCLGEWSEINGNQYVGEFRDGKYHGQGKLFSGGFNDKEGIWENGRFQDAKRLRKNRQKRRRSFEIGTWY